MLTGFQACSIGMTITICERKLVGLCIGSLNLLTEKEVRSGLGEPLSSITGSMRVDSLKVGKDITQSREICAYTA